MFCLLMEECRWRSMVEFLPSLVWWLAINWDLQFQLESKVEIDRLKRSVFVFLSQLFQSDLQRIGCQKFP